MKRPAATPAPGPADAPAAPSPAAVAKDAPARAMHAQASTGPAAHGSWPKPAFGPAAPGSSHTATALRTPFAKLLVANRGEVALRILRTAHRLGCATVAVHSTADAGAPHVRAAGEAVAIAAMQPAAAYRAIDALVEAARRTGAEAVHPGYGFLAENADFARACRAAGLVFVGPSAEAITAMGDKAGAKARVAAVGVPCIPGYAGDDQDDDRLAAEAAAIGYPVMIKARAGGGGRGMRRVERAADFAAALRSARSEAEGAFGDGAVILELALDGARHIEVQVFADRHGGRLQLGERDCSVQRRHQKLIEEAPSPAVDAALRERLGASALAVLDAVAYEGAGTVEFLLDRAGRHHFMEMNTRLQVEHPVTEAITGLDLVEWQLRVAAGERLPLDPADVRCSGHAIEVRLCAEDPQRGFLPQSGTLALWQPPAGLRVEHALESGAVISPDFDSMIAKLVVHAPDRDTARRRLAAGLRELVALGVSTNREYLVRCLDDPVFAAGAATTAFAEERGAALRAPGEGAVEPHLLAVAALLLFVCPAGGAAPALAEDRLSMRHPLAHRLPVPMRLVVDGTTVAATVTRLDAARVAVDVAGARSVFDGPVRRAHELHFRHDGVAGRATFVRDAHGAWLQVRGRSLRVDDSSLAAPTRAAGGASDGKLRAAMAGRVVALLARPGDRVEAGTPLLTLEAMKMEHAHAAPRAGVVAAIHVAPGDQVAAGHIVAEVA